MATVNYVYRSVKRNEELELRLTQKMIDGTYRTIIAKSGIRVFAGEGYGHNPFDKTVTYRGKVNPYPHYQAMIENDGKTFFDLCIKNKSTYPDYTDVDRRNAITDILSKSSDLNSTLAALSSYMKGEADKTDPEYITKDWLVAKIGYYHNPKKESSKTAVPETLLEYFDYYLKVNTGIKYGTAKKFATIKSKLIKRLDKMGYGRPILMKDVDNDFKETYESVFGDYAPNTISRDLKEIKTLCRHADSKGVAIGKDVLQWRPKVEDTNTVYLLPDEIDRIKELSDLPEHLDNARDWLVISCLTGQRVSDFMRFEKKKIRWEKNSRGKEIPLVEFRQVKTGTDIALPLHGDVLAILDKRGGEFPRKISDQKYNDYIKEVAQVAKINTPTQGSKLNPKTIRAEEGVYPKWQLVTSHIGRRSFATNNYGKVPTALIMSATGHVLEKMFLKYIGKTKTEQAKQLADYF